MVCVFTSRAIDHGFEPLLGQIKDYAIVVFLYFSAKHTVLISRSKDWLARNQNNVSDWSDLSIHGVLYQ